MKFIIAFFLIMLLSFVACLYFPWWSIAAVAFMVIGFLQLKPASAFLCGFSAIFLLWIVLAYFISSNNDHLLARKVSVLILKMENPFLLILVTGIIGGLVAGCGALTASFLRRKPIVFQENVM